MIGVRGFSTVPDVYVRLYERIAARPGLVGVQVELAHPGQAATDEMVVLSDIRSPEQDAAALSGSHGPRDENYMVMVVIDVMKPGVEKEVVLKRAFAIGREIEVLLREDPGLGGVFPSGNGHAHFGAYEQVVVEDVNGGAYWAHMDCRIDVWARI